MNLIAINFGGSTQASTFAWSVGTAVAAGVILFLLNWGRELLTAHWKRENEAGVLALTLATQLDEFISGCSDVVANGWTEDETGMPKSTAKTPSISFAHDIDWWVFPKELQHVIRSLPNKVDVADRALENTWEYGDPWEVYHEREERYADIGLAAIKINAKLAKRYGVPLLDRGSWSPETIFRDCLEKYAKQRKESHESGWFDLNSLLPGPPMEELKKRHADLATALDTAISNLKTNEFTASKSYRQLANRGPRYPYNSDGSSSALKLR
jgi:hypothetical protein